MIYETGPLRSQSEFCLCYIAYILSYTFSNKSQICWKFSICLFLDVCMVTNRNIPVIVSNILGISLYGCIDLVHHLLYGSIKERYSRGIWGAQGHCYTVLASTRAVLLMYYVGRIERHQGKLGDVYLIN